MISHKYKIIFIHIPKCAGRSISHAFGEDFDHFTAAYYQATFPQYWKDYTVFTTVRNPYQRLISMYYYIKNEPVHANQPITNFGNMPPFKTWVITNMEAFKGEFANLSNEGDRESDGDVGSAFWFSSEVSRLSANGNDLYYNIHLLRYEDGMQAIENFVQLQTGLQLHIPHLNRSHSNSLDDYLRYYDQKLLNSVNNFPPFIKDCKLLNYPVIEELKN